MTIKLTKNRYGFLKTNFSSLKLLCLLALVTMFGVSGVKAQSPQTFSTTGTWTCPAGVTSVQVECWGAGGAGGSAVGTSTNSRRAAAGGGAGGAYVISTISVVPNTIYTVTVGTGGVSSTSNGVSVAGGDSWFSTNTTIIAKGGAGANSLVCTSSSDLTSSGGVGTTTGSIGTTVYRGGDGASGTSPSSTGFSGGGGSSAGTSSNGNSATNSVAASAVTGGGIGGTGRSSNGGNGSAPVSGVGGGGGGAWAAASATQRTGGSGRNGQVILTWTAGTPSIAFSTPTIPTSSVNNNSTNNIIGAVQLDVTTAAATLTGVTFTTAGTYTASDIATNGFKFWSSTSPTDISSATQLGAAQAAATNGSNIVVSGLSHSVAIGTRYIVLSADIVTSPTNGATIGISSTAHANVTFSSGTKTGTDPVAATGTRTIAVATPAITLSSPTSSTANFTVGTTNNELYRFDLAVITANATLSGVTITTAGTYVAADLTNLKCWYSADATFNAGSDVLLSTKTTSLGAGSQVFPTFSTQAINSGTTGYIFITTDIPLTSTPTNSISVNAITNADIDFLSGSESGTSNASGTKTIIDCTPTDATGVSAVPGNTQVTVSFTVPACYDEIMIVAKPTTTIGASPSGNGSAYTASLAFGTGGATAFDGTGFVVYKGATSSQIVTGLSNGTQYFFKLFTRRGTVWSAGTEVSATPTNVSVGDYRSNTVSGTWTTVSHWDRWNGSAWVTASAVPATTTNVTILNGHTYTLPSSGTRTCANLTIDNGGIFLTSQINNRYLDLYGNITCNGIIGTGSTFDGVSFEIQGGRTCSISGSGTFDAARIRNEGSGTLNLNIGMNVNLRHDGTALYNNVDNTIFNINVNSGSTLTLSHSGNAIGSVFSIDGIDGASSGDRAGTLTVNGTLTIGGGGNPLLIAKTNNTVTSCIIVIGATGVINTVAVDFGASGTAGHTFSIASGGVLNITSQPASFVTPSNTNNTYTFNAASNFNYNRAGVQTIYTFGSSVYQGNITLSGSGVKSVPSTGILNVNGTLTTGGLLTLKSDASGTASIGTLTTGSVSGNVNVERFVTSSGRRWRFLSSPIQSKTIADWRSQFAITGPGTTTNTTVGDLNSNGWHQTYNNITNASPATTTSVRLYVEANSTSGNLNLGWGNVTTATPLTAGQGFRTFIRGPISGVTTQLGVNGNSTTQDAVTLSLSGTINSGDVTPPSLTYSGAGQGWNLLGNPYPSAYNFNAHYDANIGAEIANVNAVVYAYNSTAGIPAYVSFNASSNIAAGLTGGIIPSGAGFFIEASSTPTFVFKETYKTTSAPSSIHKTDISNLDFGIKYSKDTLQGDYMVVKMFDGATLNSELYDIKKLKNEDLNLSAYGSDNIDLTASCIPFISEETRIKLNVEATEVGTYKFDFTNMDNFDKGVSVSLFDRYTNKTTDVKANTVYTFEMGAGVNQWGKNRFELILNGKATTGINNTIANNAANTKLSVYPNPATDVLNISLSNGTAIETVNIYNISGKLVNNTKLNGNQIDISQLNSGVYMVEVLTANGSFKTKFVK